MGVSAPFKGSAAEWLNANGWRHVVHAESGKWNLREYPDQVPAFWAIYNRLEPRRMATRIFPSPRGGWIFDRDAEFRGAPVKRFSSATDAFHWWVQDHE